MNKSFRIITVAILLFSLFGLFRNTASAAPVFEGFLDIYSPVNGGVAGPIFTGPLTSGNIYRITVEGTFSVWARSRWNSVCAGTPEDAPIYPSPATTNGKVGLDAAYVWSYPTTASVCSGGLPLRTVPYQFNSFEISRDGGTIWEGLNPVEQSFQSDHIYHYEVVLAGDQLGFRFKDNPLTDNYGRLKITVEKVNRPPTAVPGDPSKPYEGYEGSPVEFDGSGSSDPDGDALTYNWVFGDGNTGTGVKPSNTYADNGTYDVCLTVTDVDGASSSGCTTAEIFNVAPSVDPIHVDHMIVPIGKTINAHANFTDPGILDTHTAMWDWGDGSTSAGLVDELMGSGSVTGSHAYMHAGQYGLMLTVTDKDGDSGHARFQYVLVYDPRDFVTGGGWIWAPEEACAGPCGKPKGKINFGFVAKYNKNLDVPSGQTEFQYKDGGINFHSTSYEWLVIIHDKAMYQGVGTVNGSGKYGFILTAIDRKHDKGPGKDLFRMKIWDYATGEVIYDTQPGADNLADPTTEIQGGSIVIHDR